MEEEWNRKERKEGLRTGGPMSLIIRRIAVIGTEKDMFP